MDTIDKRIRQSGVQQGKSAHYCASRDEIRGLQKTHSDLRSIGTYF
jgi:hypothetical protein